MSLASNLPIALTEGAAEGQYWHMHILPNQISCLKSSKKVVQVVETMTSCIKFMLQTQPNQACKILSQTWRLDI